MTAKVFIDGHAGTIGLRIRELLADRSDLEFLEIEEARRKEAGARRELLNACDVAILCLPDEASREAVAMIDNAGVRVIDGSTAFRVDDNWVYGLPELSSEQRASIVSAKRVSNPGCWPTCVALLTRPLVDAGLLPTGLPLSIHGLSGYTGGGKSTIAKWESAGSGLVELPYEAPYSLDKRHKHIPEMLVHGRLAVEPYFRPAVGPFARGMRVQIPLHQAQLASGVTSAAISSTYRERYTGEPFIRLVSENAPLDEFALDPRACHGTNRVELRVIGHPAGHVLLVAVLDNLGKGASGAAVQSLNLMLGLPEQTGLEA